MVEGGNWKPRGDTREDVGGVPRAGRSGWGGGRAEWGDGMARGEERACCPNGRKWDGGENIQGDAAPRARSLWWEGVVGGENTQGDSGWYWCGAGAKGLCGAAWKG